MTTTGATILELYRQANREERQYVKSELVAEWCREDPAAFLVPGVFPRGGTPPVLTPEEEAEIARREASLDDNVDFETMMKMVFDERQRRSSR